MPLQSQAEIFIKTLTDMRDTECALQSDARRRKHKAHTERYLQAWQNDHSVRQPCTFSFMTSNNSFKD